LLFVPDIIIIFHSPFICLVQNGTYILNDILASCAISRMFLPWL
jgi:hypothetical protein